MVNLIKLKVKSEKMLNVNEKKSYAGVISCDYVKSI